MKTRTALIVTIFIGVFYAAWGVFDTDAHTAYRNFALGLGISAVAFIGFGLRDYLKERQREADARLAEGRGLVWCRRDVEAGL